MEWFYEKSLIFQALLATLFTWGMAAPDASVVFFRGLKRKMMDMMMSIIAGVMIVASFPVWLNLWPGLLVPGL